MSLDLLNKLNDAKEEALGGLPLSHRFGVFFFAGGLIPNPIDIRFQKVSGLGAQVDLHTFAEGGENTYNHRLPKRISFNNLVLERGVIVGSPLTIEFNLAFSMFKFYPSRVLITLFNEKNYPVSGWMFSNAYPVKWSTSNLDANSNQVAIDTMELAYTRYQAIKL